MSSIIFDLETSDTLPNGQIINYCFVEVDDQFDELSRLTGLVRLSPTELPRAGAILANRTNVIEHQAKATDFEFQAMARIASFIEGILDRQEGVVPLIGYNSNRFDVPFLRASFMRNGVNPFFFGRLRYCDVFHLVQYLYMNDSRFPEPTREEGATVKLSLKLEDVTRSLGLLTGKQTHFSDDDVELTRLLCKALREDFDLDIRTFDSCSLSKEQVGVPFFLQQPNYERDGSRIRSTLQFVLASSRNYFLVADVQSFNPDDPEQCVRFVNAPMTGYFTSAATDLTPEELELVGNIRASLEHISFETYFRPSECDIENDVYRLLNEKQLDLLTAALVLQDQQSVPKLNRDAKSLYLRYALRNRDAINPKEKSVWNLFSKYIRYRYSGTMKTAKFHSDEFYPSYRMLCEELESAVKNAENEEDRELLGALQSWYLRSGIGEICQELSQREALSSAGVGK